MPAHLTLLLLHIMPPAALTQHYSGGPLLFMLHIITANGGEDSDRGAAGDCCRFLLLPTVLGRGMFQRSTATPTPDPPRDSFIHVLHITE